MAGEPVKVFTSMSIRDAAALFQQAMKVSWFSEFKGQGTEFMKPPRDDAFGDLENDPPDFEVMAVMGGGGTDWQKSAVWMFAWNRDGKTEIHLNTSKALLALGVKAGSKVRKFTELIRQQDPGARMLGGV